MADKAIAELTALEMIQRYRGGALSPVEAAEACLDRIDKHDDKVNAVSQLDEDATIEEARRSAERYRRLQPMGLLDGVPVAVKDIFVQRGWPNLKGSRLVDPDVPETTDAPAVAALRRHGFVTVGRVTTPEFGWKGVTDSPLQGATNNPWDPETVAGGSSGGSSAAVALGMAPLSLGTDAGGSVRIPAAFSGIVGHKPTQGLAPMWPPSAYWPIAHVGPMAWTVEDTALLMDVICERDARDATLPGNTVEFLAAIEGGVRGLRVAYSPTLGYVDFVDEEIAASVAEAAAVFEELGAHVDEVDPGFDDPEQAFTVLFYGGAANALRNIASADRKRMDPGLVEAAETLEDASMLDYLAAMNERNALVEQTSRFHETYDLLLTPTLPIAAFGAGLEVPDGWPHKRWHTWTPFTWPFNLTGQPACSVPCGFTGSGLPIGLQLVGPRHADALVLRAAHTYQKARPLTDLRPDLVR